MGMTYKLIAKNGKFTAELKDYIRRIRLDRDYEITGTDGELDLTDDMIFDRECLGGWMGLKYEDYVDYSLKFRVTKEHLDRAISTLQKLIDKVSSMPYVDGDGSYTDYRYKHSPDGEYEKEFLGPPENIAIMKEVMKVFARGYHYTYPWEHGITTRQERMIQALKVAREFMERFPDWEVFGLYY